MTPLSGTPTPASATTAGSTRCEPPAGAAQGYVRWRDEPNRGFLRSLHMLQLAAGSIGEMDEEVRCDLFLRQLDPEWGTRET